MYANCYDLKGYNEIHEVNQTETETEIMSKSSLDVLYVIFLNQVAHKSRKHFRPLQTSNTRQAFIDKKINFDSV